MRLHVILCILVLAGFCIYFYQFHEDKYQSVVSYVVESANSLKERVATKYGPKVTLAPTSLNNVTPHSDSQVHNTVLNEIVDVVLDKQETTDEVKTYTDQTAWKRHLSLACEEVEKIPLSEYGANIRHVALSYFTKFDPQYKFLYCSIPKVASTNWKRTIIVLSMDKQARAKMTRQDVNSLRNVHNDPRVRALTKVDGSPLYPPYSKYYKFVLFRHPFTRMVSAWRNKLLTVDGKINKYFYKNYGIPIIRLTRGKWAEAAFLKNQTGNLVTFQEFVAGVKNGIIDRHWMPQSEICQPCNVDYNHVGFFEYLNDDTNHILDELGVLDDVIKADKVSPAGRNKSTTVITQELFNSLPSSDVDALYDFYKRDFVLFGYDRDVNSPSFPFPGIPEVT